MALESLNRKSKVVVYNSDTDLAAKGVIKNHQGLAIEDVVNFEKIVDDLIAISKTDARAQALKFGESFFQISPSGATQYVCIGEYGKTLVNGLEFVAAANSTIAYTGTGGVSTNNVAVTGGSAVAGSDIARVDITIAANAVTAITVDRRGTNYKAGDVLTILGTDIGGATPDDDITITLAQADLNSAELIDRSFTTTAP